MCQATVGLKSTLEIRDCELKIQLFTSWPNLCFPPATSQPSGGSYYSSAGYSGLDFTSTGSSYVAAATYSGAQDSFYRRGSSWGSVADAASGDYYGRLRRSPQGGASGYSSYHNSYAAGCGYGSSRRCGRVWKWPLSF